MCVLHVSIKSSLGQVQFWLNPVPGSASWSVTYCWRSVNSATESSTQFNTSLSVKFKKILPISISPADRNLMRTTWSHKLRLVFGFCLEHLINSAHKRSVCLSWGMWLSLWKHCVMSAGTLKVLSSSRKCLCLGLETKKKTKYVLENWDEQNIFISGRKMLHYEKCRIDVFGALSVLGNKTDKNLCSLFVNVFLGSPITLWRCDNKSTEQILKWLFFCQFYLHECATTIIHVTCVIDYANSFLTKAGEDVLYYLAGMH